MKPSRLSSRAIAAGAGIPPGTLHAWLKRRVVTAPKSWGLEDAVALHVLWQLAAQGWSPETAAAFVQGNRHLLERGAGWLVIARTADWGLAGGGHSAGSALLLDRSDDFERAVLHFARTKADLRVLIVFDLGEIRKKCEVGVRAYLGSLKRRGRRRRQLSEAR